MTTGTVEALFAAQPLGTAVAADALSQLVAGKDGSGNRAPLAIGQRNKAASASVALATDDDLVAAFGAKTDAASTATDATPASGVALLKQVSKSVQTLGAQTDVASTAVDATPASGIAILKQISTGTQAIGAKADAVATTDTGTFSAIALLKRLLGYLAGTYAGLLGANLRQIGGTAVQTGPAAQGALATQLIDPATGLPATIGGTQPTLKTSDYPQGATPVTNSSGNVAAAVATATLAAVGSKTNYLSGFHVSGAGATSGLPVSVTVTGVLGGTLTYTYTAVAGVLLPNTPLNVSFNPPLQAAAQNTAIVVSCPSLGTGNTNNTVNAHGYVL